MTISDGESHHRSAGSSVLMYYGRFAGELRAEVLRRFDQRLNQPVEKQNNFNLEVVGIYLPATWSQRVIIPPHST